MNICWSVLPVQTSTSVVVSNTNAQAAAPLVVKGYDVSGEVQSDGEPMKSVTFLLYSATLVQEVSVFGGQNLIGDPFYLSQFCLHAFGISGSRKTVEIK